MDDLKKEIPKIEAGYRKQVSFEKVPVSLLIFINFRTCSNDNMMTCLFLSFKDASDSLSRPKTCFVAAAKHGA